MTKGAIIYNGEKAVSSINSAEITEQLLVKTKKKNEIGTLLGTIHKIKLKMEFRSKYKTGYCKTLKGKHRQSTMI